MQEGELANLIKNKNKNVFGLSCNEFMDVVQSYVTRNKTPIPLIGGRTGQDWWLNFKKCHNLSILKPKPLENARKKQTIP